MTGRPADPLAVLRVSIADLVITSERYLDAKAAEESALDALAAVERLVEAARARVAYGHNDTCDTELCPEGGYACTCGHDDLAAALALFDGGEA